LPHLCLPPFPPRRSSDLLIKNVHTTGISLVQCRLHDLFSNPFDLDVHLQCSNTVCRTCDFKVHVAKMIFITQDVRKNCETLAFRSEEHTSELQSRENLVC